MSRRLLRPPLPMPVSLVPPRLVLTPLAAAASTIRLSGRTATGMATLVSLQPLTYRSKAMPATLVPSRLALTTLAVAASFDRLGDAAERKAQSAIIGKAPTTMPAVPNKPVSTTVASDKRARVEAKRAKKRRRLEGSGMADIGPIELGHGASVSAVAFDRSVLPEGATVVNKTNALQLAY